MKKKNVLKDLFTSFEAEKLSDKNAAKFIMGGYGVTSCKTNDTNSSGKSDDCDTDD